MRRYLLLAPAANDVMPPVKARKALAVALFLDYLVTMLTDNTLNYVTEFGVYVFASIGMYLVARRLEPATAS